MALNNFDVVVVGGGPAGSLAAYNLAARGVKTVLLDATVFPRPKSCGGGLQARTLVDLPFDVSHLFRGAMYRMTLSCGLREYCTRYYHEPLVYSILRTEFDHYLIESARRAGALIVEACRVRGIESENGPHVTVNTERDQFLGRFVVGADGANSIVRHSLNTRRDYFWQTAVSCEIPEEFLNLHSFAKDSMLVDWGTLPSGYAWMFPKRGYANVGAGGPITAAKHLKSYVEKFSETAGVLTHSRIRDFRFVGHQLPTLTRRVRLSARRLVLVGDAAGVVEPFTGDGISFACKSAHVASDCIFRELNAGSLDSTSYHDELLAHIGAELAWSRQLLSISVAFPRLIYRLFKTNDAVWKTFCRTVRGEESFHRLKKDVLGPLRFAWKAVDLFAQMRERAVLAADGMAFETSKAST